MGYKPAIIPEKIGDGCDVGVMLRNTRMETPKNTRIAHITTAVHNRTPGFRWLTEFTNRQKVFEAWEEKWGPLDRTRYHEVRHVHLTAQVLTELLVYPEWTD